MPKDGDALVLALLEVNAEAVGRAILRGDTQKPKPEMVRHARKKSLQVVPWRDMVAGEG
jgi:hypothetical protein